MLFANLAKWDDLKRLLILNRPAPKELSSNHLAIDQLMELFVRGADGTYNKSANFDYLSYLFADIAKHPEGREYFITKQSYDFVIPLTKLTVFTEHHSPIRRKGVASTIKNVAFDIPSHPSFLSQSPEDINILPYLLLPLAGSEDYDLEDMETMLPDLQLLPPDKKRDTDPSILQTHVETLMLLTTTREGRDTLREIKVYPIIREMHLRVEDEDVREVCERLVQVLMRDEEGEDGKVDGGMKALERSGVGERKMLQAANGHGSAGSWAKAEEAEEDGEDEDEDEDNQIVEV
jgi:hypothetical protein